MKRLTKNLYKSKQLDSSSWEVTLSDETHPVFLAHFESNPLLPAFLQVDIMSELIRKEISQIDRAKFKLPILPNDTIVYKIVKQNENRYRVKIFKDDIEASDFRIRYA
ncbi:MAG: 3-hydroxyacyl-ACP dehydratase [Epsilonproteobacteria bacterium]|nr:3-hydroxyacyl-ACP dehydratase [Campylobacterota bacterium]